ncbi:hypothetical protein COZ82_01940 [Candidatus Kaiserbacteria bacterium CG_4_8_14_3_um_filter_38_9]|uniref:Uncharacterized protein n=1 Tax=Candidatus Kaiserbacteria bacterium CG_4_8_14_3_um_filter_38_9 TaxID=1974599 RepID=A0A2M7IP50_9BACT|nr:MAG: hypothetical protein COZ82_01940 [Candidatus Kaiserbacteria bacterium CG_4_8_14_3_um_filter_38_9]
MKKQDVLTLLITFIVGIIIGVYLFFAGFAPQFLAHNGATDTTYSDFSFSGKVYGGCSRNDACPSFQVLKDGSFSYLPIGASSGISAINGNLSKSLMQEFQTKFTNANLEMASRSIEATTCDSYLDGMDYHYQVTLKTVVYNLDTCGTDFLVTSDMGATLEKLWSYFATLE